MTKQGLEDGKKIPSTKKPPNCKCSTCGRRFVNKCFLIKHLRFHLNTKKTLRSKLQCQTCGIIFKMESRLLSHARIHVKEKNYSCKECGRCFKYLASLTWHERLHKGLECLECGECFTEKGDLEEHITSHESQTVQSHETCSKEIAVIEEVEKPPKNNIDSEAFALKQFSKLCKAVKKLNGVKDLKLTSINILKQIPDDEFERSFKLADLFDAEDVLIESTPGLTKVLEIFLSSKYTCVKSLRFLTRTIDNFLKLDKDTTLLDIGCGNGLLSILLSSKCQRVVGLDHSSEIDIAEKIVSCQRKIRNVSFEEDNLLNVENLFSRVERYGKVAVVINQTASCGLAKTVMLLSLHLSSLQGILVLTPFTDGCFPSLMVLLNDSSIKLRRFYLVEKLPGTDSYYSILCFGNAQ